MRRIFRVNKETGEVYEAARSDPAQNGGVFVLPDLNSAYSDGGFRSPIDGTFISSRSQLRAHNIRHGVIQTGDIKPEDAKRHNLAKMQYDPSERNNPNFSWSDPDRR